MAKEINPRHLEKKITKLALELNDLRTRRKKFIAGLDNLNKTYTWEKIDYDRYSALWDLQLSNRTAEYWMSQFESRERELVTHINRFKEQRVKTKQKTQVRATLSYATVLLVVLASIAAFTMLPAGVVEITGAQVVNDSTVFVSEVNITAYFSVAMSENLSDGISFPLSQPGLINLNATDNYANTTNNGTTMYLVISTDSNVDLDMCINASDMTTSASDVLAISNMTYSYYYNETNITRPLGPAGATEMTNSPVKTLTNMIPGTSNYYRFWIGSPASQPAGVYNNTVEFRSVQAGQACT